MTRVADSTRRGAVALIDRALDLFERSGSHSVGALARDQDGTKIAPSHAFARRWDVNGALCNAAGVDRLDARPSLELATDLTAAAATERGYASAMRLNDILGKPGAVWMLRRARDLADEQEDNR